MSVLPFYLPATGQITDEYIRSNFEFIEANLQPVVGGEADYWLDGNSPTVTGEVIDFDGGGVTNAIPY